MRLMSIPFLLCCCAHIMSVGYLHSLIDFVLWKVHITQGNHDGTAMIISWVTTIEPGSSTVVYGTSEDNLNYTANGKHTQYTFYNYTSGYIHHCTIKKLEVTNSSNFWTDVCLFFNLYGNPNTHLCCSLTQSITMLLELDKRWGNFGSWPLQKAAQMFHIHLVL